MWWSLQVGSKWSDRWISAHSLGDCPQCWEGCDTPNHWPRGTPGTLRSLVFYPAGFSLSSKRAKLIIIKYHIDYVPHVFKLAYILETFKSGLNWSPECQDLLSDYFPLSHIPPWVSFLPSYLKEYNDLWYLDLSVLFPCPLQNPFILSSVIQRMKGAFSVTSSLVLQIVL